MCGIAGWADFKDVRSHPQLLAEMVGRLRHRGPDAQGFLENGAAHLGHCRLSIIDLACGSQPMGNEDGSVQIIFNGEIYNYCHLREQLLVRGHQFRTFSDTEVIVHLYEEQGADCVKQLRGQFAFAIWDSRNQRMMLARDRMGEKPLYWAQVNGRLIFASEMRAILAHRDVPREIDPASLETYLACNYVPAPRTILKSISKLPPAHWMLVEESGIRTERYWQPSFARDEKMDEIDAIARFHHQFCETIRLSTVADVPVGVFLSGGIDSALVTAYLANETSGPVKTFSIGFEHQRYNELPFAREVAQRFGTEHHEFVVTPSAVEILPDLAQKMDEPMGDSSAIAFYYLAKMTRANVTVALGGDGGDELFAGYARHEAMLLADRYQHWPGAVKKSIRGISGVLQRSGLRDRWGVRNLARFLNSVDLPLPPRYARVMSHLPLDSRRSLIHSELRNQLDSTDAAGHIAQAISRCDSPDTLSRVLHADQLTYLPGDLLVKTDRMAMAHGLEGRSPLLDHPMVELANAMPNRMKIRGRTRKYLLKRVLRKWFDDDFIHRQKMGFAVPMAEWLRGELRETATGHFNHLVLAQRGILDQAATLRLFDAHLHKQQRHEHVLWSILLLEQWFRRICAD